MALRSTMKAKTNVTGDFVAQSHSLHTQYLNKLHKDIDCIKHMSARLYQCCEKHFYF